MTRRPAGPARKGAARRREPAAVRPPWWRRRLTAVAAALVVVGGGVVTTVVVTTGADSPAARPLTTDEADTLAVVRFQNYRRGTLDVTALLPASGGDVHLAGRIDFRRSIGSMTLRTSGRTDTDSAGIVQFSPAGVAFNAGSRGSIYQPLPTSGWQQLPLRTDGSNPLDTLFALMLNLGADRPENAQLLRQQGARWLRDATVDGDHVEVLTGPSGQALQTGAAPTGTDQPQDTGGSRTRYWVDDDGLLRRFQARIGSNPDFATVTLSKTSAGAFRVTSALPLRRTGS